MHIKNVLSQSTCFNSNNSLGCYAKCAIRRPFLSLIRFNFAPKRLQGVYYFSLKFDSSGYKPWMLDFGHDRHVVGERSRALVLPSWCQRCAECGWLRLPTLIRRTFNARICGFPCDGKVRMRIDLFVLCTRQLVRGDTNITFKLSRGSPHPEISLAGAIAT